MLKQLTHAEAIAYMTTYYTTEELAAFLLNAAKRAPARYVALDRESMTVGDPDADNVALYTEHPLAVVTVRRIDLNTLRGPRCGDEE